MDLLVGGSRLKPKPFIVYIYSSFQHFRYLERDGFFQGADAGARNASVDILLFKGRSRTRCVIMRSNSKVWRNKDVMVEKDNISCRINE